ncbi:hypothetical protein EVU97_02455 [Dermacoccus sp. 147Ba]|nr:hypothetical protein EVU97_02455 [Dermacoccus sp. 147Ba]
MSRSLRAFWEPIAQTVVRPPSLSWMTRLPRESVWEMPSHGRVTSRTTLLTITASAVKRRLGRAMTQNESAANAAPKYSIGRPLWEKAPATARSAPMTTPIQPM